MHKYAIITGASRGIGKTCAQLFSEQGWQVISISRQKCEVANVTQLHLDLGKASYQELQTALQAVANADQICLIHNAAAFYKDSIQTIEQEQWHNSVAVNLTTPIVLNQVLIPWMKAGSAIIYVGSTLAEKAVKNTASYVITKHAQVGLMRATCQDLDNTGIHTCCICPGFTDTEMLRQHTHNDPTILNAITQQVCARRLIQPREIAETIYFCATHPVINGEVIHANLGQLAN
ncbi:MAG: SDR family oxidoreductase [Gammaproteobacteria bacterium]